MVTVSLGLKALRRICLWLVTIGELHVEALSPENRVLNYKIDLLAPFPKRESQWVKETGGWIHEKKTKENSRDKGS